MGIARANRMQKTTQLLVLKINVYNLKNGGGAGIICSKTINISITVGARLQLFI
jgi:hypothetical protein